MLCLDMLRWHIEARCRHHRGLLTCRSGSRARVTAVVELGGIRERQAFEITAQLKRRSLRHLLKSSATSPKLQVRIGDCGIMGNRNIVFFFFCMIKNTVVLYTGARKARLHAALRAGRWSLRGRSEPAAGARCCLQRRPAQFAAGALGRVWGGAFEWSVGW